MRFHFASGFSSTIQLFSYSGPLLLFTVLSIAPNDEDAVRCKIVALIKADSIEEALLTMESFRKLPIDFSFFKDMMAPVPQVLPPIQWLPRAASSCYPRLTAGSVALSSKFNNCTTAAYCKYRQNWLNEALDLLKGQDGNSAAMLLQSQILSRMGKMDASLDIYQKLQKSKIESMEINLVAGLVSAGRASEVQGVMDVLKVKATSSFELAYNTACSLISRNKYSDAEQLLLSARRNCREEGKGEMAILSKGSPARVVKPHHLLNVLHFKGTTWHCTCHREASHSEGFGGLIAIANFVIFSMIIRIGQETLMEENLADDDVEIELAPITVQLAYVQQLMGRTQEAAEAYTEFIKRNLGDESSLAVATNNLVSVRGAKDVSDSIRKLDRLMEKSSGPQNFHLANGLDLKLLPKQREAIYANRVLLLLHSNKIEQARELVAMLPDMFPDSVMPVLLQAALLVRENKAGKAEDVLDQFSEKHPDNSKVVLLARAQVAAAAGHPQVAAESLAKIPDIQHMPATVATLVSLKERAGDIEGAVAVFDSSIQWWSNSMAEDSKLSLIMQEAASFKLKHGRKEEAARLYEELVKTHGSIDALVGLIKTAAYADIDKAEAYAKQLKRCLTSGAKNLENGPSLGITEPFEAKGKEKAKKKRKRKPRYPKGFDPANPGPPPDPERWLPKRERSSYRPRRKDKRAAQVRGSQGAVVKETVNTNVKSSQTSNPKGAPQSAVSEQRKSSKSSRKKSRN
ncbi:unnamed protein product [Thlaspi arvense]|uniref:Signal recognition particle subunit SRP72 n=1 Tax=Thlaspi arvense TaxID=13288 RepID=A0AAU9RI75_THLAR|nr:unnamed protein product [Thlaspi arvense]